MSLAKLSDAAVRWLLPRTTAAACRPPDPCDSCANPVRVCYNGRMNTIKYTLKVNNCSGQCVVGKKQVCWIGDPGRIC
ncbi:hypothetical protein GCM10009765_75160 [Fodinicola feengrottensis]|uniref:Uncharacterized protein n=1 Tax=Fodinicola feengrottensis TaxID=435914 RepID=A0ABN2J011_9ACTN